MSMTKTYQIEVVPGNDGFIATIPVLRGCSAWAETKEEAIVIARELQEVWLELAPEEGWDIPEPDEQAVIGEEK